MCIEGNIGSGKSESLVAIARAFPTTTCLPEPIDEWSELLDLYYASPAEWAFPFSLKVLASFRRAAAHDRCIVERSPLASRHVFSQLLYNEGVLNCHEWELFKEYHDALSWKPDVIFFIDTPAELCKERIERRGRECEKAIELAYLKRVEFQYANMLRFAEDVRIVKFDGTLPPDRLHEAMIAEAAALGFTPLAAPPPPRGASAA